MVWMVIAAGPVAGENASSSDASGERAEYIITRDETIETRVGEKRTVRLDARILTVSVTRPEVADVFLSTDHEMVVRANSPGVSKAIVQLEPGITAAFTIRVHVADPDKFANTLRDKIGNIQNVHIEVVKGKILVSGRILYLPDMDVIERVVADNPSIINLTSLTSRNARILAREIKRELRESGIYGADVEVRNNRVTLIGSLGSEVLVRKAEYIASTFTPNFDSLLEVTPQPAEPVSTPKK
jgi:Flp pilus assembly secretin CpaC